MARSNTETMRAYEPANRMSLKAPGLLTFLLSFVIMLAVMFAKYFGASIPGLSGELTQFTGLLIAYVILAMGCIFRAL